MLAVSCSGIGSPVVAEHIHIFYRVISLPMLKHVILALAAFTYGMDIDADYDTWEEVTVLPFLTYVASLIY